MRIWKRLLGTALCLCAAACVLCVGASAAEHTDHPICGKTHKDIGDHTETCGNVTWTAWDGTSAIQYDETTKTAYVYLTGETTLTDTLEVKNGHKLYLCLNGKTLKGANNVITVEGGGVLNICDCKDSGGKITNTSESNSLIKVDPDYKGTATLNLYGGKVSGSVNSDGAVMLYNNAGDQKDNAAIFNMYGGEVCNTGSGIFVSYSRVGTGFFGVNIYGGTVASENTYGIDSSGSRYATVLVAGGEIKGNFYAIRAIGNLKLSGSPLIHADEDEADIGIITASASTLNDYITVADDFALVNGATISVYKSIGITGSVRISKPETGKQLGGKAEYFVSAEKGYFVESNSNGDLQLTACAITEQPTVENSYTVEANGGDDKVKYQWYSTKSGDVPVTSKNATTKDFSSRGNNGEWGYGGRAENGDPVSLGAFTLHMNAGDKLTLTNAREVETFSIAVSGGTPNALEVPSWWSDVSYTAPADGEYTLTVTARPRSFDENNYHLSPSFKATVTADVPDKELSGQTAVALNTTGLPSGSYICQVTWENKTTRNSQTVRYAAASSHVHSWSKEWKSDATHHWHECENGCTEKNGYAEHSGGTATCQAKAVCVTCGTAYGALDAANHSGALGGWQWNEDKHWKEYSCCHVHADEGSHHWDDGKITTAATCTAAGEKTYTCSVCKGTKTEQIDALGHDWGEWAVTKPATTSAAGEETRTCKRDKSHTETRAIPKLTPAPSGGGSSSGSSSAPAVTVPVSGSGDTVHVSASVSGSTAEVKEIKRTELDKIGTDSAVVIDLSGLNKGVTGVTLSTDTIDSIYKTEADGVTIKLPGAELRVDRRTLAAVTEQAAGSKIRLVVEPDSTARGTMTAAQKSTLAGMKNAAALEAYFVSNDTRIHDFKGGSVELSIPYQASGALRAWFLKEDGTREPVSARYDKENALLILHHFSHYVIEELDSSAAYTVCAKDDSCPLGAFGDLTAAAWYHDGVHYCLENGLMRGVSGGKFLPDGSTTRAQLVTVLWRLEGSPETTGAVRFGDTAGGAWYTEAVRWAAGCGVVKGYDNGCFGPNDAVTREQMAAILYRYAQHKGYDVSAGKDTNILSFSDAFAVSEYAIPAMQWACGSGLMTGAQRDGGMLLAPRDTTTRAQAATLIMRFQSAFAKEP